MIDNPTQYRVGAAAMRELAAKNIRSLAEQHRQAAALYDLMAREIELLGLPEDPPNA